MSDTKDKRMCNDFRENSCRVAARAKREASVKIGKFLVDNNIRLSLLSYVDSRTVHVKCGICGEEATLQATAIYTRKRAACPNCRGVHETG